MFVRCLLAFGLLAPCFVAVATDARAQDVAICFGTADRVMSGEPVDDETKRRGHEACQRALSETASIVQKYHLQEADFDIVGRPPKAAN